MLWKLRLFWVRADKAGVAAAAYFVLVAGSLVAALCAVHGHRDAEAARMREFHARSLACLARNVYYESRGESVTGQYAVAEVTMNRWASGLYPRTVCGVVYQKDAFSWTALRHLDPPEGDAWERALEVAGDVYYRRRPPALRGALHFHATYVRPDWANERERVGRIGRHVFYR